MIRTLIRSYTTGQDGDIIVLAFDKNGQRSDLSKHYEDVPRNRHAIQPDSYLDVFRYEDGDLSWSGSPNGHDPASATSFKLLLDAFVQDLGAALDAPRAF